MNNILVRLGLSNRMVNTGSVTFLPKCCLFSLQLPKYVCASYQFYVFRGGTWVKPSFFMDALNIFDLFKTAPINLVSAKTGRLSIFVCFLQCNKQQGPKWPLHITSFTQSDRPGIKSGNLMDSAFPNPTNCKLRWPRRMTNNNNNNSNADHFVVLI